MNDKYDRLSVQSRSQLANILARIAEIAYCKTGIVMYNINCRYL